MAEATVLSPAPSGRISIRGIAVAAFFAALWLGLWRQLSGEWSVNDQYSYGWFVPLFAIVLFWLRFEDANFTAEGAGGQRPEVKRKNAVATGLAIIALLLLFPIRLVEIGNPDWRPLDWLHAGCVVGITLIFLWSIGARQWLRHFAFPVAFTLVAVPWVTPIEEPIVQGLMRLVANIASEAAALFGIPTTVQGNLIRISSGLLGVNEACSGVRSLQTAIMIGLLFGELKRLSILRRAALVCAAIGIAFLGNCIRAFALVWIAATQSLNAANRWHDFAGYGIVAAVFVGTLFLTLLFSRGRGEDKKETLRNADKATPYSLPSASYFAFALAWMLLAEAGASAWYRAHEHDLSRTARWEVKWPSDAANFHNIKVDDDLRRALRFDAGEAASWNLRAPNDASASDRPLSCTVYFFRWDGGKNSALLANLHRPDVCLPAIGWQQTSDSGVREFQVSDNLSLPFRHFQFVHGSNGQQTQQIAHAFYCLWEDFVSPSGSGSGLPRMETSPSAWTRSERLEAVRQGRRHLGQQVLEVVIGSRGDVGQLQVENTFNQLVPQLVRTDVQ
jgi:exosortase